MGDPARIIKIFAFILNKRSNFDILDNWQNPQIGSLICGMRAIMMERQLKPSELPLSRKVINQKQDFIPKNISDISASAKDLKDAGVVILTLSLFNLPIWPMQKTD